MRMFGTKRAEGKKIGGASLDLPKIRRNPLVEIIAINTGIGSWLNTLFLFRLDFFLQKMIFN